MVSDPVHIDLARLPRNELQRLAEACPQSCYATLTGMFDAPSPVRTKLVIENVANIGGSK